MTKSGWFWEYFAKRYDRQAWTDEGLERAAERLAGYLEPDDTVLDYACGTGVLSYRIAGHVQRVLAIDASAEMIRLAKQRGAAFETSNVRFTKTTLFDDELGENAFDVLVAYNILHLLEDAGKAVERAADLLKPGGRMITSTPCLGEAGVVMRTLLPLIARMGILSYLRAFRVDRLKEIIHAGGFEIVELDVRQETIPICFVAARKP